MSAGRRRLALGAAGLLPGALFAAATAQTIDLSRCASIVGADARLACYDALANRPTQPIGAGMNAPAAGATPVAAPTVSLTSPAVVAAPAAAVPAPQPDAAAAPENFGFSSAQLHAAPKGPQSIQAHVDSVTLDQTMRNFVVLDNGQTWLSTDGELELNRGELVTIRRASLGSFMLSSTVSKHSYHVRRVR